MLDKKYLLHQLSQTKHPDQVLQFLLVIKSLLFKYGKKLTLASFLDGIEGIHKEIGALLRILSEANLLRVKPLSDFIREFKLLLPQENLEFSLKSNDEDVVLPLKDYLEKKFGKIKLDFEHYPSENLMVNVKGEGYSFKRSLEKDIDKLLA